jgi:hypothetical protein
MSVLPVFTSFVAETKLTVRTDTPVQTTTEPVAAILI